MVSRFLVESTEFNSVNGVVYLGCFLLEHVVFTRGVKFEIVFEKWRMDIICDNKISLFRSIWKYFLFTKLNMLFYIYIIYRDKELFVCAYVCTLITGEQS